VILLSVLSPWRRTVEQVLGEGIMALFGAPALRTNIAGICDKCIHAIRPCLVVVFPKGFLPNPHGGPTIPPFGAGCPASARVALPRSTPCSRGLPRVMTCHAGRACTPQASRVCQREALEGSGGCTSGDGQGKIPFVLPIHSGHVGHTTGAGGLNSSFLM
jgi:hypothetical protein